jgi:hypothetical protein
MREVKENSELAWMPLANHLRLKLLFISRDRHNLLFLAFINKKFWGHTYLEGDWGED